MTGELERCGGVGRASIGGIKKMSNDDVINSAASLLVHINNAKALFAEHKYITYAPPRIGKDRSISQNSLLHVWLTEYAAFILDKTKKAVTPGELDGMKRAAKAGFIREHPACKQWMVHTITNPFTKETRSEYTSSASYKKGEMFLFLTYLQMVAAGDGLILESRGEFEKNQRESEGI